MLEIKLNHAGVEYHGEIMKIKSTTLGWGGSSLFTAFLNCEGAGSGISVGGFGMDEPRFDASTAKDSSDRGKFLGRFSTAYGMDLIVEIIRTVGTEAATWESLKGQDVIVLFEGRSLLGGRSVGIASLDGTRVLVLAEHFKLFEDGFPPSR